VDTLKVKATLRYPRKVCLSKEGILYVIDTHGLKEISLIGDTGEVQLLGECHFYSGVAVDSSNNIYIAHFDSNKIHKIAPGGKSELLAGGASGYKDGNGIEARFNQPSGIATDYAGNIYVAEWKNHTIRKITPDREVITIAGIGAKEGFLDGTSAQFKSPLGIAVHSNGVIYVTDFYNHRIRQIANDRSVSTLAGNGNAGCKDGKGTNAEFNQPSSITIDEEGVLYVADQKNDRIRKITPDGMVTTIAGSASGYVDGPSSEAQFAKPGNIFFANGKLYITESEMHRIRTIE